MRDEGWRARIRWVVIHPDRVQRVTLLAAARAPAAPEGTAWLGRADLTTAAIGGTKDTAGTDGTAGVCPAAPPGGRRRRRLAADARAGGRPGRLAGHPGRGRPGTG